ncbi:MAG: methyl-accepting chemotaxis protein [Leptonema sp. (in: bacteria)]
MKQEQLENEKRIKANFLDINLYWKILSILHLVSLFVIIVQFLILPKNEILNIQILSLSFLIIIFTIIFWENTPFFNNLKYLAFPSIAGILFYLVDNPAIFYLYSFFALLNFLLLENLLLSIVSFFIVEGLIFWGYLLNQYDFILYSIYTIFFLLVYCFYLFFKTILKRYKIENLEKEKTLEALKDDYNKYLLEFKNLSSTSEQNMLFYQNVSNDISKIAEEIYKNTMAINERISNQNQSIQNLNYAIQELTKSIQHTTDEISKIVEYSELTMQSAEKGKTEIQKTIQALNTLSKMVEKTSKASEKLIQSINKINKVLRTIEEIAGKTNLLSLNAAIEAARSGEAGKGFAVVADEVSKLSERTTQAVKEISSIISELHLQSDETLKIVSTGHQLAFEGISISESSERQLRTIIEHFKLVSERLQNISAISEEQSQNVETFANNLILISKNIEGNSKSIEEILKTLKRLQQDSENLKKTASEFEFTEETKEKINIVAQIAQEFAKECGKALEEGVKMGILTEEDLFDRTYIPIPNTNPQKFHTKYDTFTDKYIQNIEEEYLKKNPGFVFAVLNDDHGYIPTHNLKYSKPLTGNYEIDLVGNRTKRIFDDTTGLKAATNTTKPFLLQSYRRDTGEIMHDMSSPVYVFGKHWGAVRIGFRLDKL